MTTIARLLDQRSVGEVTLRFERGGPAIIREFGSSKCRIPKGGSEAILINTSGGLAGGDQIAVNVTVGEGASLCFTSQTAERVYRSLGPPAEVKVTLKAEAASTLLWLPQETILFEQSVLQRSLDVELHETATFLAVEPLIFGRHEMGEKINRLDISDRWAIRRDGRLLHAEQTKLGPTMPSTRATLGNNRAMATLLFVSPEATTRLDVVRNVLGQDDGASVWNGKLVARLLAKDGFHLRKTLIKVLIACVGTTALPKTWTF
ncbi:MAG: urease accessory protein UreD [Aestuariivirga sp.]